MNLYDYELEQELRGKILLGETLWILVVAALCAVVIMVAGCEVRAGVPPLPKKPLHPDSRRGAELLTAKPKFIIVPPTKNWTNVVTWRLPPGDWKWDLQTQRPYGKWECLATNVKDFVATNDGGTRIFRLIGHK